MFNVIDIDSNELYYLLSVLLLAFYPIYRLWYYIFDEMYTSDVEHKNDISWEYR